MGSVGYKLMKISLYQNIINFDKMMLVTENLYDIIKLIRRASVDSYVLIYTACPEW